MRQATLLAPAGAARRDLLRLQRDEVPILDIADLLIAGGEAHEQAREKIRAWRNEHGTLFSDVLLAVTHIRFPEDRARELWQRIVRHKKQLTEALGRDPGIFVAALDYLSNVEMVISDVRLLPATQLESVTGHALRDSLTGLYDRASFQARLVEEIRRFEHYGQGFSLIMIDLDEFKKVNDRLGHQAGDRVLVQACRAVRDAAREDDVAARYGGDELCILAPGANLDEAAALAERLRVRLERVLDHHRVTASFGVASCPQHGVHAASLLSAADEALYVAKHAGKNRVEKASMATR